MYIIYKTDNQHSYKSRDVIGLSTSKGGAVKICKQHAAEKEGIELTKNDVFMLNNHLQTQGYAEGSTGDGEFVIEEVKVGVLL